MNDIMYDVLYPMNEDDPVQDLRIPVPITPDNLVFHELIGLPVRARQKSGKKKRRKRKCPPHSQTYRTTGTVVDETKHLLVIETYEQHEEKKFIKVRNMFRFTLPDGSVVEVDGDRIAGRPEDRLKNIRKKRWK